MKARDTPGITGYSGCDVSTRRPRPAPRAKSSWAGGGEHLVLVEQHARAGDAARTGPPQLDRGHDGPALLGHDPAGTA
ncbi:hypothetical protein OG758_09565 [Streptomyces sp. NBC_01474]|uniref:hypothetical protein n=1 Tax=unclassified Streptomyces TaxID=2593676 RepID=UPI002DDAB4F4|nr:MULTISPECIES: hypothetical protein [unclassified Streptomyces]WSD94394.1 hypothetical protein OG758_09565 [Streptomyces sp. NBC_01474]